MRGDLKGELLERQCSAVSGQWSVDENAMIMGNGFMTR
jgi:hypothetical protein